MTLRLDRLFATVANDGGTSGATVALSSGGVNCHLSDLCHLDDNLPPHFPLVSYRSAVGSSASDGREDAASARGSRAVT